MKPQDTDLIQILVQQERERLLKNPPPPKPAPEPPARAIPPHSQEQDEITRLIVQQEREWLLKNLQPPRPDPERPTIHWTELAEAAPSFQLATEWNLYRQQVGRLLTEGHEGKWILIKGEEIIGIWESEQEAWDARVQRFPRQDAMIHQILEREPLLRGGGYFRAWRG